jgi:mRNA-degrading endonuclease RelE of RelBE toxin-antitoxin system
MRWFRLTTPRDDVFLKLIFPSCHPRPIRANDEGVFQVIFNKISAAEMAALPKDLQLELLSEFHFMPEDSGLPDKEAFGRVTREGRTLHRYRARDYRIYFERHPEGLVIHRVLHKNTIRDFLFRSNLPLDDEDGGLAGTKDFWTLIHEAEEARK